MSEHTLDIRTRNQYGELVIIGTTAPVEPRPVVHGHAAARVVIDGTIWQVHRRDGWRDYIHVDAGTFVCHHAREHASSPNPTHEELWAVGERLLGLMTSDATCSYGAMPHYTKPFAAFRTYYGFEVWSVHNGRISTLIRTIYV